jgi:hypothetical protein
MKTIELTADQCAMVDAESTLFIKGGRTEYEHASFTRNNDERVRLERLTQVKCDDGKWRLRQINRYVPGNTIMIVELNDEMTEALTQAGLLEPAKA